MCILVTGGGGFIGSHVVRQLAGRGEQVRVLHLPGEDLSNLEGLEVERVAGNVLHREDVRRAVEGCDRVFHLAAVYAFWLRNPRTMFEVNIEGTRHVMDACLEQGVDKVVYTSSAVRFGGQGEARATEESEFRMGPTGELYSLSKYQSHELVERFAADGLNVTLVCPTLPFGPGDIGPTPTGKYLIDTAKSPVLFYTDAYTNIGDVRDFAAGHLLAMEKGQAGRSYLLGGLEDVSMKRFIELCQQSLGKRAPKFHMSDRVFEAMGYAMEIAATYITRKPPQLTSQAARASALGLKADCSRAVRELGYTCRPLEESIRDALEWFRSKEYL